MPDTKTAYETRDMDIPGVVLAGVSLAVIGAILLAILWGIYRNEIPETNDKGVSYPVVSPGEPAVNDRIGGVTGPRLDGLRELHAEPPSYTSSPPVSDANPRQFHPEDLRADRQSKLNGYGWIDRKKGVARIPIDRAIDAVVDSARAKEGRP